MSSVQSLRTALRRSATLVAPARSASSFGRVALVALAVSSLGACATVSQDQVGVRRTFGKVGDGTVNPGLQFIVPGVQGIVRLPARTVNREVRLELPSKEGLNVASEVSILYRIKPEMAPRILETAGQAYEDVVILPVFRSAAADVSARFMAKDMYGPERVQIEKAVQEKMSQSLNDRGFIVESVLLKSIRLPAGLAQAVEDKLEAEQRAEQMQFILQRERLEAERKRIEAEGIKQSQDIIASSLTPMIISFKSIEAFREIARSPNAKLVMTDGRTPYLIAPDAMTTGGQTAPAFDETQPGRRPATETVRRAARTP